MGRARARAGFTLLEVVLAMTALGMLTAIIYAAFHLGTRALDKGTAAVVTAQRLRAATDVLDRQIKSMVAYPARDEDEGEHWYFRASPTSLSFVTAAGLQGGGGLVHVTYTIEDSPPRLLITENAHFNPDQLGNHRLDDRTARTAVLLDGFRSMRFEYWDADENGRYETRWDPFDHDRIPPAVRVSIDGLPGVDVETVSWEIPVASFEFSGAVGPDELMNEEAEAPPGAAESGEGGGAAASKGGGSDQGGGDEPDDPDMADEADGEDEE